MSNNLTGNDLNGLYTREIENVAFLSCMQEKREELDAMMVSLLVTLLGSQYKSNPVAIDKELLKRNEQVHLQYIDDMFPDKLPRVDE